MVVSRRVWTLAVLAALVAMPSAAAEPARFDVEGTLPLEASGDASFLATSPALLFQSQSGSANWHLATDALRLVHIEYWQEEPGQGFTRAAPHSGARTTEHLLDGADLRVMQRLDGFTSLVWSDDDPATTAVTGQGDTTPGIDRVVDMRMFRLSAPLTVTAPSMDDALVSGTVLGRPVPFRYEVPTGDLHLQANDARHLLDGGLAGYVTGATVQVAHEDGLLRLELTERTETRPGSIYVPDEGWTGPGTHTERINHYIQFTTAAGVLHLDTTDAPAALFAPTFDAALAGHLALAQATGSLTFDDGTTRSLDDDGMVVAGTMDAHLVGAESPHRVTMQGNGDVSYLRAAGIAETFPYGAVAATAAGVAALVGAALAVWKVGGGAGITLFSRVAKNDVLDHETRATIYELVKTEPGCTPNDLVSTTGIGWSTVMYHLSVLERNDLVVAMKDGRYRRYFDRQSGRFANGRKKVVSALKNDTTAAIAQAIRAEPGQVQRRLAERFELAASSVHWHVSRLADAGLVEKRRVGQRVELFPGPAWDVIDEDVDLAAAEARADARAGPTVAPDDVATGAGAGADVARA